eukprot:5913036-Alexandrium_andersonii.AAC.1
MHAFLHGCARVACMDVYLYTANNMECLRATTGKYARPLCHGAWRKATQIVVMVAMYTKSSPKPS